MDISFFREFAVLAETQNYWAAAERLFISQSALSKHIKTMEQQFGASLFYRTSRKVTLTEFGQIMLPYARTISRLQHDYESAAFNFLNRECAPLEMATIPEMAHYNITKILVQFRQDHPTVQVNLHEVDSLVGRELLIDRKCELAILRRSPRFIEHDPEKEQQLVSLPMFHDRLMVVLSPSHPLAKEKKLSLQQLKGEHFAFTPQDTLHHAVCVAACRDAGFVPDVLLRTRDLESILDLVRSGNCISLLFENQMDFPHHVPFDAGNLPFMAVPVDPEIHTTVCLCYRKDEPLSSAAAYFTEYLRTMLSGQTAKQDQPGRNLPGIDTAGVSD